MKKMVLLFCLMVISSSSFGIVNFSTSTGALVMRDVVVNDTTVYDSVTLQLNLANGTFTILDATLRDTTFENAIVNSSSENGLKVDFYGCALTGKNQITCMTKVISVNKDLNLTAGAAGSTLFDDLSNEYSISTTTALDKAGWAITFKLIQGIPVEVKFIFNGINSKATSISLFKPFFEISDNGFSIVHPDFRDIDF